MNMWRIAGVAFVAGLVLFLVTILFKLLLIAGATALLIRVVGGRLMSRMYGPQMQGRHQSVPVISIDNPAYRVEVPSTQYARIIPIN